jgi:hypothetical protein
MKRIITKLFAVIFALAAFLSAAGAVYLCAEGLGQPPVLLTPALDAQNTAVAFLKKMQYSLSYNGKSSLF